MKKIGIILIVLSILIILSSTLFDLVVDYLQMYIVPFFLSWGFIFLAGVILYGFGVVAKEEPKNFRLFVMLSITPIIAIFLIKAALNGREYILREVANRKIIEVEKIKAAELRKNLDENSKIFNANYDGTITNKTGNLMWQPCSIGQTLIDKECNGEAKRIDYSEARNLKSDFAGYNDWRLPTKIELETLIFCSDNKYNTDRSCSNLDIVSKPTINVDIFSNTPSSSYWTYSKNKTEPNINFGENIKSNSYYTYSNNYVRLVRTPMQISKKDTGLLCEAIVIDDSYYGEFDDNDSFVKYEDYPVVKKGEILQGVIVYKINKKTHEALMCLPRVGCIAAVKNINGKIVETIKLTNCLIGDIIPKGNFGDLAKDNIDTYDLLLDTTKFSGAALEENAITGKLEEMDVCSACSGYIAKYYMKNPSSKCADIINKALRGDEKSKDKISSLHDTNDCEKLEKSEQLIQEEIGFISEKNSVRTSTVQNTTARIVDMTLTPDQLVTAEHSNKARFLRDIVGKTVKVSGRVKDVSESFFSFEATGSFGGWTVYTHDNDFLANLDAGKSVTINCRVVDMPLIGGASKCD